MTSKELIDAAGHTLSLRNSISKKAIACAEHVLATVRADDDEPLSYEWARSVVGSEHLSRVYSGSEWIPEVRKGESHGLMPMRSTRGQFRQLCRGLGIELKETT